MSSRPGFVRPLSVLAIGVGLVVWKKKIGGIDYSLGSISSVDEKGKITKGKVLVATDVSDNYVMLLGSDESEFKENEKIMDEIWGSFTMRSGGASGAS